MKLINQGFFYNLFQVPLQIPPAMLTKTGFQQLMTKPVNIQAVMQKLLKSEYLQVVKTSTYWLAVRLAVHLDWNGLILLSGWQLWQVIWQVRLFNLAKTQSMLLSTAQMLWSNWGRWQQIRYRVLSRGWIFKRTSSTSPAQRHQLQRHQFFSQSSWH